MRILFLNTTYSGGGAEQVTRQIYNGMKARGHQVYEVVCYNRRGQVKDTDVHVLYSGILGKIFLRMQTYNRGNHNLTIPYAIWYISRFVKKNKIDVIHLHNPHDNFLGIMDIAKLQTLCPVIWTLHDFWALTGHCAFPFGCDSRWENGCSSCDRLENYPRLRKDVSGRLYKKKARYLTKTGIHLTVPSDWMREQVKKSYLREAACTVIYNSLDISKWKVFEKEQIRAKYGWSTKKLVLAFVAADLKIPQKGMRFLADVLAELDRSKYMLLIAGRCSEELQQLTGEFETKNFGYISEQKKMNEFYAMADILINPSVYETFGLVNIEAMASGTPVLAFNICVMPEVVGEKVGWCIPEISAKSLQNKLEQLEADRDEVKTKAQICPEYINEKYNQQRMLDQYEDLYRSVQGP